jgi:hypothetical protein
MIVLVLSSFVGIAGVALGSDLVRFPEGCRNWYAIIRPWRCKVTSRALRQLAGLRGRHRFAALSAGSATIRPRLWLQRARERPVLVEVSAH